MSGRSGGDASQATEQPARLPQRVRRVRVRFEDAHRVVVILVCGRVESVAKDQLKAAAQAEGRIAKQVPEILFICVHNAGRSQIAAALAQHLSAGRVHVRSAGSAPTGEINPSTIEVLRERGIDLTEAYPKP